MALCYIARGQTGDADAGLLGNEKCGGANGTTETHFCGCGINLLVGGTLLPANPPFQGKVTEISRIALKTWEREESVQRCRWRPLGREQECSLCE